MAEYVDVWQMNNTFGNLQVEEGTFQEYTSSQNGRTNGEGEKYVEIIEEPQTDGYRFRYKNEKRNAGPIKGVKSKDGHTTHPTIKIHGYRGSAKICVSLVTINGPPYYPHPHNLVGKHCKDGIFEEEIKVSEMPYCFSDLRIQCVKQKKKKEVEESLKKQEMRRIEIFKTGFARSTDLNNINFTAVRLCIEVLLPDSNGKFDNPVILNPVISKPIYDAKTTSNMSIKKLSHCNASVEGGKEIILLCGKINKDDTQIVFDEEKDKKIIWTAYGHFFPKDVHNGFAISFRTPAYNTLNVHKPINCFIYLRRKSDGTEGRRIAFTLLPMEKDSEGISSKRRKYRDSPIPKDLQLSNLCSPKPDDNNLRVKKGEFETRRNNEKIHCTPRTIQNTVRKDAMHNNVESTPRAMQNQLRKEITYENVESTPRAMQNQLRKEITYENVESTPRAMQNPLRKEITYENVESTPRAMQNQLRKEITYENVESTPRAMQNPLRKEITYENVGITSKSTPSPIREFSQRPETSYVTGTVNKFNLRCNPGSTFNPLPSTSVLRDDSYVENGPLDCNNSEKHASAMSQDQFVGAPSLDLPPNTQQLYNHVYPADFENSQLNKPISFGDPRESDEFKMLSKDVDPNQNDSNENESSGHLNSGDIISAHDTLFDMEYGLTTMDEEVAFENNFGVSLNTDADVSKDDKQMSIENNVRVLQNSDAEFSADYCLDRQSNLSLEPNSEDTDVTMRDVANYSLSEAVGISILASS